ADVDHAPEAARRHALDRGAAHVEHPAQVDVQHLLPLPALHLAQGDVAGDAGGVDEDVERAARALGGGDELCAGVEVGHVQRGEADVQPLHLAPEGADALLVATQVGGDDAAARVGQGNADRGAETAYAAGDDGRTLAHRC